MQVIVPLAGPDFERPDGRVKAELEVDGSPLLRRALESRAWWRAGAVDDGRLTFVLRDTPLSRKFALTQLADWYPRARRVHLSASAAGAAYSATAGVAMIAETETPLCIDLADILFETDYDPLAAFRGAGSLGGALLTFPSSSPQYSYAELDEEGQVVRTAEKKVISNHASAGVYFFASPEVFLTSLAYVMSKRTEFSHNGLMYVCPMLNGVIAGGLRVTAHQVTDVNDVKNPQAPP